LQRGSYNVKVPRGFPKDSAISFVKLALGDNPELINVDNCQVYVTSSLIGSGISLSPVFKGADALNAKKRFDEESEKILKSIIKPGTNAVQRVLAIHDYLVANVTYDEDDFRGVKSSILSHTAYGAIIEKKAVCEGISYAFCHLAKKVGLSVTVVNGTVEEGDHAWNIVQLGSDFYHVDVTWDIRNRPDTNVKAYDYFCLCDADLTGRVWNRKLYPECKSSRYNYFNVTRSFAHNREQLREILLRQYQKYKSVYLKYDFLNMGKQETIDYIWNELVDVAMKNGLSISAASVSLNEKLNTFVLYTK
jgi:hypothetical protein